MRDRSLETLEEYLKNDPLRDPEDIDALLALAELTRELIRDERDLDKFCRDYGVKKEDIKRIY